MNKDIDAQFLCKDCERYNLCEYYHKRKKDSYICKYFHLSVTPQEPRKGHWLGDSAGYKCDKCGHDLLEIAHSIDYIDFKKPNFCPNCGADMREVEG